MVSFTLPALLSSAAILLLHQFPSVNAALYSTTIQTKYGPIQGYPAFNSTPVGDISNWKDITVWKGIPFAASPAFENRWRPPQPRTPWTKTLYANKFGPTCWSGAQSDDIDEDCLYLNIWTAGLSTKEKRPVVIWSYPAGGDSSQPLFDGGGMASQGLVFVNFNYRVGAFGWLAHPDLSKERYQEIGVNSSGNWGMLDQFAALKWVHENIADFGGDPNHITAMGQSAGSASTYHMVNSPLTKGLIVGAIIESGLRDPYDPLAPTLAEGYTNLTVSLQTGLQFAASRNATTIAQLRKLPASDLNVALQFGPRPAKRSLEKRQGPPGGPPGGGGGPGGPGGGGSGGNTTTYSFGATLDNYALPNKYIYTLQHGPANDVPIITGNTKDESGADANTNITVAEYVQGLQTQYGPTYAAEFLKLYPAANDSQADMAFNAHYRDSSLVSSYLFAEKWQLTAKSPIYTYYWDHAPPGQNRGAYHESEINYALNNLYLTNSPWQAADYAIALKMNGYWANFAKTGNPNCGGSYRGNGTLASWFPSTPHARLTQEVGNGFGPVPIASPEQVALISEFFATQPPL